jgi:hypothetical protein
MCKESISSKKIILRVIKKKRTGLIAKKEKRQV